MWEAASKFKHDKVPSWLNGIRTEAVVYSGEALSAALEMIFTLIARGLVV